MKLFEDASILALLVASTVIGGLWCANDMALQDMPKLLFKSSEDQPPLPNVTVNRLDWSADGEALNWVLFGEPDGMRSLARYEAGTECIRRILVDTPEQIIATAFAHDGRHVLLGTCDGKLNWVELESCSRMTLVESQATRARSAFTAVAVADDGSLLAGGTETGLIYVCDPEDRTIRILTGEGQRFPLGMHLSPGSTASQQGCSSPSAQSSVSDLQFSTDRRWLVSAQNNGTIGLWDLATGELLQQFVGHRGPATAAALLPNGKQILSTGLDDTVRLWDIFSGNETWRGEFGLGGALCVAVSADGATAAWAGYGRKIIVWDLEHQQKKFELTTPATIVPDLEFSPDGSLLAAAGKEGSIRLYDVQTGAEKKRIQAVMPAG